MDSHTHALADRIIHRLNDKPKTERILVAIAGVPGSGKSTLAYPLIDEINSRLGLRVAGKQRVVDHETQVVEHGTAVGHEGVAVAVGLDGWHRTRAELDQFPDPLEARRRRGAAFTFNAPSYVAFVHSLLESPPPARIPFPTFSHALKDPLPSPIAIEPHHRIIVIEGLYTLLDEEPWVEAARVMDERVWVECEPALARERLVARHLKSGVETEQAAAEQRVDKSDMLNGQYIREHLFAPTVVIPSVEDPAFVALVPAQ